MVSGFTDSKTMFNTPTIEAKDLHEIPSTKNNESKLFKRLLRNTIPVACKIIAGNEVEKMQSHLSILKSIQPSNKIIKFHGRSMMLRRRQKMPKTDQHGIVIRSRPSFFLLLYFFIIYIIIVFISVYVLAVS